ncbi:hypothetical protein LguiA_026038 [Lonicera macranthoides]
MASGFETHISCEVHQSLMDTGLGKFGCSHYRRKCKIRAPCCDEIFDCRHCHNKAKWDCIALLDDVDSCDEAEFRMQIRHLALTSLELLNAAIFDKECEPQWQIYLVLLGLFLALAIAFYMFFQNSNSFWKLPIARDQTARPKIEAILGDPQSEDQWGAFGLLDM